MATAVELLERSWSGELLGEAFFDALIGSLPDQRPTWELLARVEHTTGALIEPVARRHGVSVDAATVRAAGTEAGEAAHDLAATVESSLAVAAQFLAVYEELGTLLGGDDAWLGPELVTHEQALSACLEGVRDGSDRSAAVRAYLRRHG